MQAYGFRYFSLRYSRYFSPFPRGTGSLSVSRKYSALPDGAGRFRRGVSDPALLRIPSRPMHFPCTGLSPALAGFPKPFQLMHQLKRGSYNPSCAVTQQVWALPRSLATTWGITPDRSGGLYRPVVFSSSGYLDVSVPLVCLFIAKDDGITPTGLPHSDTCGSPCLGHSPQLFAALRVLPRLREPRHPPYALCWLAPDSVSEQG